jgi:hypothetical protein
VPTTKRGDSFHTVDSLKIHHQEVRVPERQAWRLEEETSGRPNGRKYLAVSERWPLFAV